MQLRSQYLQDILSQPQALRRALERFNAHSLEMLVQKFQAGKFSSLIITGMGASYYATYPLFLKMCQAHTPPLWIDTSELIHYAPALLQRQPLLWVFSQSGRSAEIVSLLERLREYPDVTLLATTNHLESPLAQCAHYLLPIDAEEEQTVSTRTMMNTLAISLLAGCLLLGLELTSMKTDLLYTLGQMERYLDGWEEHVHFFEESLGLPEKLFLLGRGPSLFSTYYGALILGEAAKFPAIPMQAAQFRHGPLEMAQEDVQVICFAGEGQTYAMNLSLAEDLVSYGARVFWVSCFPHTALPEKLQKRTVRSIPAPAALGEGLPLAEIVPIQLLSVYLAQAQGWIPGKFRYIGKVTLKE